MLEESPKGALPLLICPWLIFCISSRAGAEMSSNIAISIVHEMFPRKKKKT